MSDDNLWTDGGKDDLAEAPLPSRRPPNSKTEPFVRLPLRWASQAAAATNTRKALVWVRLLHVAWKTGCTSFPLPNGQLAKDGVTRFMKGRALLELETAGLITVKRRHGRAPIVTLIVV